MTSAELRFVDKVVVITGGGAGIGRRFAHRFAAEGASIVVADLDPEAGQRLVQELESEDHDGLSFPIDVRDADAAARMSDAAVKRFGGIDVLVNNAGLHLDHAQLPYTLDALPRWRNVLDVNVLGALACAAACHDAMAARDGGAIINMSSMAAYSGGGAYGVSKLALNSLTVGLAECLRRRGNPGQWHRPGAGRLRVGIRMVERSVPLRDEHPANPYQRPDDQASGPHGRPRRPGSLSLFGPGQLHHRPDHPGRRRSHKKAVLTEPPTRVPLTARDR